MRWKSADQNYSKGDYKGGFNYDTNALHVCHYYLYVHEDLFCQSAQYERFMLINKKVTDTVLFLLVHSCNIHWKCSLTKCNKKGLLVETYYGYLISFEKYFN